MDIKTAMIAYAMLDPRVSELESDMASITNPMLVKGTVDTVADLENVQNPQPGWVYLVGLEEDPNKKEYVYTDEGTWDFLGYQQPIDAALSTTSENAVQNKVVTTALNSKADVSAIPTVTDRLKSIAAAAAFDPSGTYATGDYMTLDGELYKCDPNGSELVVGDDLFITYASRIKDSTYGYRDNYYIDNYGGASYSSDTRYYVTGTIPLTNGAKYRLTIPAFVQVDRYTIGGGYANNASGQNPTLYSYNKETSGFTTTITASGSYMVHSVYKLNETGYRMFPLSSAKFVKTTIADELDTKQDTLTFDSAPTENSLNPVTSGGVYTANGGCITVYLTQAEYDLITTPDANTEYNILETPAQTPSLNIQSTPSETRAVEEITEEPTEEEPTEPTEEIEDGDMR